MPDFLPRRDNELVIWAENFSRCISLAATDYGLTEAQAAGFAAKLAVLVESIRPVSVPATRAPYFVAVKNAARDALKDDARALAAIVRAHPGLADVQRIQLGLGVRAETRKRGTRPTVEPRLRIISASECTVIARLEDKSSSRGRPRGAIGAAIFRHVGPNPPARLCDWKLWGHTTKTKIPVRFEGDTPPGSRVWLTAYWLGPRLKHGPACGPVGTNLPGGFAVRASGMTLAA